MQGVPHGVPSATGVRLPKRPSFSPFGPAVKQIVLESPPALLNGRCMVPLIAHPLYMKGKSVSD